MTSMNSFLKSQTLYHYVFYILSEKSYSTNDYVDIFSYLNMKDWNGNGMKDGTQEIQYVGTNTGEHCGV